MSVLADASSLPSDTHSPALKDENELSEEELRRLYDDEEIERFLGLFADFVSEVTLLNPSKDDFPATAVLGQDESDAPSQHSADEWTSIESDQVPNPGPSCIPPSPADAHCVSEHIAYKYLLPMLPPLRPRPERFTMGRLRLTVQRLYLIAQPAYFTTFSSLTALATWKNRNRSALYCAVYWALWYRNLLMPAFFFCVLHSLMRRKLFPYPTLSELQERRREAARSELLGERLQSRLGVSSSSGLMEVWRLFRVFNKPNRKQKQADAKDKGKGSEKESKRTSAGPTSRLSEKPQELADLDEASISDDPNESEEERDLKRALLNALNDIADMHERAKNIILWRRPSSSRIYAALLVFLILFTAYLSTAYIVKLASFLLGFLYWHVMPIIVALPSPDRSRLPPMFESAPTDAEHAMDLIAQRIARGEDIRPSTRKLQKRSKEGAGGRSTKSTRTLVGVERASDASTLGSSEEGTAISESDSAALKSTAGRPGEVDWRKWAERAANTKSWVVQGKRMVAKSEDGEEEAEPHSTTFLAHHKASPGMLTLTRTTLLFTPITSMRSKICIALNDVCGVKKIGIGAVPGLSIKWQRRRGLESGEPEMVEEKFRWVGGRDEVFARLVGWGGRRWLKV